MRFRRWASDIVRLLQIDLNIDNEIIEVRRVIGT